MSDKQQYIDLCGQEQSIPIYSRPWWLDCVCGERRWDVLLSRQGEAVAAAMPYYMPCSGIIMMPPYVQTMGIWFNPAFESENYSNNLSRKQAVCEELIKRLPPHSVFLQNFHFSFTDWLPFYWNGFRQTTRYTYFLQSIDNKEVLERNLSIKKRQNIKKAIEKSRLTVETGISIDDFMKIIAQTFERQGLKTWRPKELKRLIRLARERGQGEIWGAIDEENRLHAAVFLAWQPSCAYYIAGGNATEFLNTGGLTLALWTAVGDAAQHSASFDFDGSMICGVERFFREFGGIQMPYFTIEKGKIGLLDKIRMRLS
ncbi:MAG: GNAT family N-acetyltransferase [Dysgonamonadaceae bacterium]|jgi:hypothetical protein|nr:GNAT family N-acetyltransferase [Dysgonamonadaceae bacterium]